AEPLAGPLPDRVNDPGGSPIGWGVLMATAIATGEATPRSAGRPRRGRLFGINIDRVTMSQAVDRVHEWISDGTGRACRCIVTPNVDHIVMLRSRDDLRAAYQSASMVVADGWPIVTASKWLGEPLPERVAGSDLVPALFASATPRRPVRVFLLGGKEGVAERAADVILAKWENVEVVGTHSPPFGFENQPAECERIEDALRAAAPDLLIIGLGAPKQELWMHASRTRLAAKVAIGAGATIDFLAGEQRRAPKWIQSLGMEWFYRAASQPRRLVGRYARDLFWFPLICMEEGLRRWRRTER
ncbi:MAG: WecB/TagA/CpsF family glycosyltransferase, partial [Planctomycetota bacterium]